MADYIIRKLKTLSQIKEEFRPVKRELSDAYYFPDSGVHLLCDMFGFLGKEHKFWFAASMTAKGEVYNVYQTKEKKWFFEERWFEEEDFIKEDEFKI